MNTETTTKTNRNQGTLSARMRLLAVSLSLVLMAGCGGGGGGSAPTGVNTVEDPVQSNSYTVTSDNYGLENATYLSSSKSNLGIVFRAAIATSLNDPAYKTVSRIDIAAGANITLQATYSLGNGGGTPFPGNLYFLNGHPSTLLKTVGGTISLTRYGGNSGDRISGSYSAVVEDGNDPAKPTYTVAGSFDFITDSYGPVLPAPGSLALAAQPAYQSYCASCHALGSYDPSASGAPDLALKGGDMNAIFTAGQAGHQGVTLTVNEIADLKVLLNTN